MPATVKIAPASGLFWRKAFGFMATRVVAGEAVATEGVVVEEAVATGGEVDVTSSKTEVKTWVEAVGEMEENVVEEVEIVLVDGVGELEDEVREIEVVVGVIEDWVKGMLGPPG